MPITTYAPTGTQTAGMSAIIVAPAVANINTPTLAEINAGIAAHCALEEFGVSVSSKTTERKKLCDTIAQKRLGSATYDEISLEFPVEDPQGATQVLLDALAVGVTKYFIHRPGMAYGAAFASGQKVQVVKGLVLSRFLKPITTADGEEYTVVATIAPQAATDIFVAVAA